MDKNTEHPLPSHKDDSAVDLNACYIQCCTALHQKAKDKTVILNTKELTKLAEEMVYFLEYVSKDKKNLTDDWMLEQLAGYFLLKNNKIQTQDNKLEEKIVQHGFFAPSFSNFYKRETEYNNINNLRLSSREYECLKGLAMGKTAKEISANLNISPRTVEAYISNLKNKTGYNSKSEMIALFWKNNHNFG